MAAMAWARKMWENNSQSCSQVRSSFRCQCVCPAYRTLRTRRIRDVVRPRRHIETAARRCGSARSASGKLGLIWILLAGRSTPGTAFRRCPQSHQADVASESVELDRATKSSLIVNSRGEKCTSGKCIWGGQMVHANRASLGCPNRPRVYVRGCSQDRTGRWPKQCKGAPP